MIVHGRILKWIVLIILILLTGELTGQWLEGYNYRKKIIIDGSGVYGSENLVNYPFLVNLTDPDLKSVASGGLVSSDAGWDISFTGDDGSTPLDHELELFVASNGELVAWVRIPSLSYSEDTDVYLYFGNQSIMSDPSSSNTWSAGYRGVWHMNENMDDASQFSNDGVNNGTIPTTGKLGMARIFNGTDDYIRMETNDLYDNLTQGSIMAWVKWEGSDFETILGADTGPCEHPFEFAIESGSFKIWADESGCSGSFHAHSTITSPTEWHQLMYVVEGTGNSLYIDGEEQNPVYESGSAGSTFFLNESSAGTTIYEIGRSVSDNQEAFSGTIDEVWISSVPYDDGWIKTSYDNQNSPSLFASVGSTETLNDLPCDALYLPTGTVCTWNIFSNINSTDSGIPLSQCEGYSGGDLWFKVEVPASGNVIAKIESDAIDHFPANDGWAHRLGLAIYTGSCTSLIYDTCWIEQEVPGVPQNPVLLLQGYSPGDTLFLRVWEHSNDDNGKFRICVFFDIEALVDIPVFASGSTSTRCKGEDTVTYTATATNSTGITYTLDPASIAGGNTIVPGTGAVTYVAGWDETSIITASATGIGGPKTALHTVQSISIEVSGIVTDVNCRGEANGAIDLSVSGGSSPYMYDWADLAGTDDPDDRSSLAADTYTVTVVDTNTCSSETEYRVSQPNNLTLSKTHPFAALNITETVNDPNQFPSNVYSGGWGFTFPATQAATYNYNSSFNNTYLPTGYTVDPEWLGNCLVSYVKNDADSTSNAYHSGGSRVTEYQDFNPGDAVNASGDIYHLYGRGIFGFNGSVEGAHDWTVTYDFSNLANGHLPAGTLIGFSDIDGINSIGENLLLTATGTSNPWLSIFDYTSWLPAHGTAMYEAPGKPANSYYFDGPSVSNAGIAYITNQNITSITINAKMGTAGSYGIKLAAPLVPFVTRDVSCNGGSDGRTTIAVSGGTEPYNYLWSNGETTKSISGLAAGTYSVLVTDANLCTDTVSQTVTQPALPLEATIMNINHIMCFGDSTGSVTVEATVSTGTAPYQYSIDGVNFGSSGTFSSLSAGSYTAIVKDTNSCTYNIPVTITQPDDLVGIISGSTPICTDYSATITVQVSGGTQPWKVTWPGGSNQDVTGTDPFDFTFNTGPLAFTTTYNSDDIIVTDANGCTSTIGGSATIEVNPEVGTPVFELGTTSSRCLMAETVTYVATASNSTGINYMIDTASIIGGNSIVGTTGAVSYVAGWSGFSIITASAGGCSGPKIATHTVTITDLIDPVIACPGDRTESLNDNCEFILPDYTTLASVSDNCDPDPSITQSPPPGSLLSGSGSVQEIELLALDHVGNESSCRFNITLMDRTPPEAISLKDTSLMMQEGILETTIDIPLPLFADNCGVLSVTNNFNGGTDASGIFRYGTTTIVYTVTDINNNIATFDQHVVVGLENGPEHGLVIPEAFSPNEDGLNDRFEILGLEQYPDAELRIFNAHGIEVYSLANYDNSWDGTSSDSTGDGNKLPTGTYYYILYVNQGGSPVKGFVYLRRE